ncbi:PriCT-2 domain-containing protein, partial [Ligilactobacillus salivarius]
MEEHKLNLLELLDYIDPSMLNYQEWVNVGMALKYEGYSVNDWDSWSQRDSA